MLRSKQGTVWGFIFIGCFTSVAMAGELDPQQDAWYAKYSKQKNAPKPADMLLNADPEPELTKGFYSLCEADDLSGWEVKGGESTFEASDGEIVGTCVPGSPSTYLCTKKSDFKNFVFTCEMKWLVDGNTGVMFRARVKKGSAAKGANDVVYGPQAEMEGFSQDRHWSGGIYGQSCGGYFYPLWLKEHSSARAALQKTNGTD